MPFSGTSWVQLFPTSKSLASLDPVFRQRVTNFLDALTTAGAHVTITATRRPRQRAYLMHYSWCIWKHWNGTTASSVPAFMPEAGEAPIDIQWVHKTPSGAPDNNASVQAAFAMAGAYEITGLHVPPALNSNHIQGKALDMVISWHGTLSIKEKSGQTRTITSTPRTGTNADLIDVGKTYAVFHLINVMADPPHWSINGH